MFCKRIQILEDQLGEELNGIVDSTDEPHNVKDMRGTDCFDKPGVEKRCGRELIRFDFGALSGFNAHGADNGFHCQPSDRRNSLDQPCADYP